MTTLAAIDQLMHLVLYTAAAAHWKLKKKQQSNFTESNNNRIFELVRTRQGHQKVSVGLSPINLTLTVNPFSADPGKALHLVILV